MSNKYGDHCLVCPCGGDRTKRHNHLRNRVFFFSADAGLNPELEKPGLLQPRPHIGGIAESGTNPSDPSARRLADVYVPRWRHWLPLAMDFAVTSGMRQDATRASSQDPSSAVAAYEDYKRNHLSTAQHCSDEGLSFAPMVVEANGGMWGPSAQKVFSELAKTKSVFTGESRDTILGQLYQSLDVVLQRENARSVVKRMRSCRHEHNNIIDAATTVLSEAGL